MKAKISRGNGFTGTVNYIADVGKRGTGIKRAEYVCGTTVSRTVGGITSELAATRAIRPDIIGPVWHCSLSMPAEEAPRSIEDWAEIVTVFMNKMGFPEDTVYAVFRHSDTNHDHIHIVASRISLSGNVFLGQWEALRAIELTQQMEKDFGLTLTQGLSREVRGLPTGELRKIMREGHVTPKVRMRTIIDEVLKRRPTFSSYVSTLSSLGIETFINRSKTTGRISGISYSYRSMAFKGSSLGKRYSWGAIEKQLVKGVQGGQIHRRKREEQIRYR